MKWLASLINWMSTKVSEETCGLCMGKTYKHFECCVRWAHRGSSRRHFAQPVCGKDRAGEECKAAQLLHLLRGGNVVWNDDPSDAISHDGGGLWMISIKQGYWQPSTYGRRLRLEKAPRYEEAQASQTGCGVSYKIECFIWNYQTYSSSRYFESVISRSDFKRLLDHLTTYLPAFNLVPSLNEMLAEIQTNRTTHCHMNLISWTRVTQCVGTCDSHRAMAFWVFPLSKQHC